jgi:RNA polymerase-binding transcription factor DksA
MQDDEVSTPDAISAPASVPAATGSREPDLAMLEQVEGELDDVERVLPRIDDGTYGTCEACGARIPDERLAQAPAARFCAEHTTPSSA